MENKLSELYVNELLDYTDELLIRAGRHFVLYDGFSFPHTRKHFS